MRPLLETLDPEQNKDFRDHYLDVSFDLSKGNVHYNREYSRYGTAPRCAIEWRSYSFPGYTEEREAPYRQ